jgi:hypothetical protein
MKPVHFGKYWSRLKKLVFALGLIFIAVSIYNFFPTTKEKNLIFIGTLEGQRFVHINTLDSLNRQISRIEASETAGTTSAVILQDSISALKERVSMYSDSLNKVEATRQQVYRELGARDYVEAVSNVESALGTIGKMSGVVMLGYLGEAASIKKTRHHNMVKYLLLGLTSFGLFAALVKYERKRK